jgi:hypothetical protein
MSQENLTADLEDRLTSVYRMLDVQPDQTRHGTIVTLRKTHYNLSDLRVVVASGDRDSAMFSLHQENRGLRDELRRVRGAKGITWGDFVEACQQKIEVKGTKWRSTVARQLDMKPADLSTYQRLNRVPVSVLKQLEAMPDLRGEPVKRSPNFQHTLAQVVEKLRAGGLGDRQVVRLVTDLVAGYDGDGAALETAIASQLADRPDRTRGKTDMKAVLAAIKEAGPAGLTAEQLERRRLIPVGTSLRKYDFVRNHLIFESGLRGGKRGTAAIWVAAEFKAEYPEAWAKASASEPLLT